jgi:hypothetical protein
MARQRPPALAVYRPILDRWFPDAAVRPAFGPDGGHDGLVIHKASGREIRYLLQEKRHLRHQDAAVVADQLNRRQADRAGRKAGDRILVLAPHVRPQQAALLERAGIDYVDLAGNAHLEAPGRLVHIEGRRPPKTTEPTPTRPQKGWIKAVMGLLVEPALADAPLRTLAKRADVALGTAAACIKDLTARGILLEGKSGREVADRATLLGLWLPAYVEGLRPRLPERRLQLHVDDKAQIWNKLQTVLAKRGDRWALTGADAAEQRTHAFRADETEIYAAVHVFDDPEVQRALVAQPAARGGNLIVIEPPGPLAVPIATPGNLPQAPDLLAYAELRYRGTDQAREAAELLLPGILDAPPLNRRLGRPLMESRHA